MCRPRSGFTVRSWRPSTTAASSRRGTDPGQIATAYGLGGLTLGGQAANGSGQTIAIVDAYNDPNIQPSSPIFDSTNNLPAPPSLRVVGRNGDPALPSNDAGWAQEEALDVEWAHAIAPGASDRPRRDQFRQHSRPDGRREDRRGNRRGSRWSR